MSTWTEKGKSYFDGWERACSMVRRHGWNKARDMLNQQYPHEWKPTTADAWQHAKGAFDYLQQVM